MWLAKYRPGDEELAVKELDLEFCQSSLVGAPPAEHNILAFFAATTHQQ